MHHAKTLCFVAVIVIALAVLGRPGAMMQSPLRNLTNADNRATSLNPSISGDGHVVTFESTEDLAKTDGAPGFHAIRADISSDPPALLQIAASRAPAAAMSQDGSRIAFASMDNPLGSNNDGNSEIFLYEHDKLVQVTNTLPGDASARVVNGNFLPSISDDGRFIAFSSNRDLVNDNSDGNLEIFVYDSVAQRISQLTHSSGIVGFTDAKISGNGAAVAYIRDVGAIEMGPSTKRDLLLQSRIGPANVQELVLDCQSLAMTYGRAISDDGRRVVWAAETKTNSSQVFLYDGRNQTTRQITSLGVRTTDVPLHPSISGNGSRIAFATRRAVAPQTSDGGVDLYTYHVPSMMFARVTNGPPSATADVVASMNDEGSVIAFNFPRTLTHASGDQFANNCEIYVTATPLPPESGTLQIVNGASFAHEPASIKTVAPESIAVAFGTALAYSSEQAQQLSDGTFPLAMRGTTVTVNGRQAQMFYISGSQVNFLVPTGTEIGPADVVVNNSEGFPSRGTLTTSRAAPGIFTFDGDGRGEGVILHADHLNPGPFDPSDGNLRLIVFATGVRGAVQMSASAAGLPLDVESILPSPYLPGLDEVHVIVPADLRGAGRVDFSLRADARDSNSVSITFIGDARRDVVINEFLADPPDGIAGDANHDGIRNSSDDEFVELVNTTARDMNIGGYKLITRGGSTTDSVRHIFPEGTILPACSATVVFGGAAATFDFTNPVFGGSLAVKASSGGLNLINSGGVITLQDSSGAIANFVPYGATTELDAVVNQALTRSPDSSGNFIPHKQAGDGTRLFSPGTRVDGKLFLACVPLKRIEVVPLSATLDIGMIQQFEAHAFDANGTEVSGVIFSWKSSSPSVATIAQNGLVTAVAPGSTDIQAVARGMHSTKIPLKVNPPPPVLTSVNISPTAAVIGVGETQAFTAQAKDQYGRDIGGVTITFVSDNPAAATVDATTTATGTGSSTATISGRMSASTKITAAAVNGAGVTIRSIPASISVEPRSGDLLISEFRTRGPNGAADEFVEIYNPTLSRVMIGGLKIRASNNAGNMSDRATIPAGTEIGSGCYYLFTTSSGYSGPVAANQTYGTGIADDGGIAITSANGTRIIDAVGMSNASAYKENTPLKPLTANTNQSYERTPGGSAGNGIDSNNNANDFRFNAASSSPQNLSTGCLNLNSADLKITFATTTDTVLTGSDITYIIEVTNQGPGRARSVIVTADLPETVSFISCASTAGGVCDDSGEQRKIMFDSLSSGSAARMTIVAHVNSIDGDTIVSRASVRSDASDANEGNNSTSTTTTVHGPAPTLSINDGFVTEANAGAATISFTVILSAKARSSGVSFDIATEDRTANSVSKDYVPRRLIGEKIRAGDEFYTFDVTVNGDILVEADETFVVNVTNVTGAEVIDGQGSATIQNDDEANLVISQIYGGGGNSGATYRNDFVELFNRGKTIVDYAVTPYSLQYAGPTAPFGSAKVDLLTGTMLPGQYFLVQLSAGGANGVALPLSDVTGTLNMAATAGKVALVVGNGVLPSFSCPGDDGSAPFNPRNAGIADFVGYGATSNCFEGENGAAAAPSNTNADIRKAGGCTDTDNNANDFAIASPLPRNTSSNVNNCIADIPPNLNIDDASVIEGNSGSAIAVFTVSLSHPALSTDITFDISTQDDMASAAAHDYVSKTLTNQIIPAGRQTYTFAVAINGDQTVETDETFFVNVTHVVGAALADGQGVGTIQNDDLPALSINDTSIIEGDTGVTTCRFTVGLSAPAPEDVIFDIATADGSANDGDPSVEDNDYVSNKLMRQTIPAGSQTYTFDVGVIGDLNIEPHENFFVHVINGSGATITDAEGLGTIENDDSPKLSINDMSVMEGNNGTTVVTFEVLSSLPAPAAGITFDISTADSSATAASGDYVSRSLMAQHIAPGQTSYSFDVVVSGDTLVEPEEKFFVNISNVMGATVADGQGQGSIQNDDTPLLVISQVYGGGGNTGAAYQNDFIELFNRGATTVDFSVTPYAVQYTAATSAFGTSKTEITSGVITPGSYFLIREAGGTVGAILPTADATGTINLAATAGKVALLIGTTPLNAVTCPGDDGITPFNPNATSIADFLGYGNSANCYEGSAPVSVSGTNSNARSVKRTVSCADTNKNSVDFSNPATAPTAHNSTTTALPCPQ
ncbi:MAG: lamin tail domain-containing protein [Pyrinomonadaceae bacterium]